jgi:hypothetical protein
VTDNVIRIAPKDLVQCIHCNEYIDASAPGTYHRGTGWFKVQKKRSGTNSAALVHWSADYACRFCIQKQIDGIGVDQMTLFVLPYPED